MNDKDLNRKLDAAIAHIRQEEPDEKALDAAAQNAWLRIRTELQADEAAGEGLLRGCGDFRASFGAYRARNLSPARRLLVEDHLHNCVECRAAFEQVRRPASAWSQPLEVSASWQMRRFAFAAILLLAVGLLSLGAYQQFFAPPPGMRAAVESIEGSLYRVTSTGETVLRAGEEVGEGEIVRTASGSRAVLRLRDGSMLEMNERAQLSVAARRSSVNVQLERGDVIVEAAKRRTGNLFVTSRDLRVAVTGTVFSVSGGIKGSRVGVFEGAVAVTKEGVEQTLLPGEQFTSNDGLEPAALEDTVAWSRNSEKYLALLAEFSTLQRRLEAVSLPGTRYESRLMRLVPAETVIYASVPNYSEALGEAHRIFQEQLNQSAVLREWWQRGKHQDNFDQAVDKLRRLGDYLGDEVLFTFAQQNNTGVPLFLAEVGRHGLREFLEEEIARLQAEGKGTGFRVLDPATLASAGSERHVWILVRPDVVLMSSSTARLREVNARLDSGAEGGFAQTALGERVAQAYGNGVNLLLSANLAQMQQAARGSEEEQVARVTGFADARLLVLERKEVGQRTQTSAQLDFSATRRGIASWLAAPAPAGSLDFISADARLVSTAVVKTPSAIFDDFLQIGASSSPTFAAELAQFEQKLSLRVREDLAAALGNDATLALDGPMLPVIPVKMVVEVNDASRLQYAIERMLDFANQEAAARGEAPAVLEQAQVSGRTMYTIRGRMAEVHYAFSDGYLIAAPSRSLVLSSIQVRQNGQSLSRSARFRSLLPASTHANFSAIVYQNMAPVIETLAPRLSPEQAQQFASLGGEPSLICAYGGNNRIDVVTAGRLIDLNLLALVSAAGHNAGTAEQKAAY